MIAHEPLKNLLTSNGLSLSKLARLTSKAGHAMSKTSLSRLTNGDAPAKLINDARVVLPELIKDYLTSRKVSDAHIAKALVSIFPPCNLSQVAEPEAETMITARQTLPPNVAAFFELRRDPFTSDPRQAADVYSNKRLDVIFQQCVDAVNYQDFVAVIGEIGAGKSVLKRRLYDYAEKSNDRVKIVTPEFFEMGRVGAGSITRALLEAFETKAPSDLVARRNKLNSLLKGLSDEGARVAIAFDECHHLSNSTLTALKNFWELGTGGYTRFLGVVLFGQPKFEARLRDEQFRELAERVTIARMPTLEKTAAEYLKHRLSLVGGKIDDLFEPAAIKALTTLATTPLALGNVANASLLAAFSRGEKKVIARFIPNAVADARVLAVRE
jgi:type II secretory pathway predicted ATPase ExeA